ncbi:hypothetical protein BC834DRAFT_848513 [Gloeopeniophorella convolvens]|nr:hypothetical protein BC834DRAFT_848513 [Gloeopeniophorella convolvens]
MIQRSPLTDKLSNQSASDSVLTLEKDCATKLFLFLLGLIESSRVTRHDSNGGALENRDDTAPRAVVTNWMISKLVSSAATLFQNYLLKALTKVAAMFEVSEIRELSPELSDLIDTGAVEAILGQKRIWDRGCDRMGSKSSDVTCSPFIYILGGSLAGTAASAGDTGYVPWGHRLESEFGAWFDTSGDCLDTEQQWTVNSE